MATNPREVQGRKGGRRVALCIGAGAGIGMALGAAIGEDGAFIGLGAGVGAAVGLILARMRRPSSGGRAEPCAPPNGGPAIQPGNTDTPKGRHR
jgi:hypothetical protein